MLYFWKPEVEYMMLFGPTSDLATVPSPLVRALA